MNACGTSAPDVFIPNRQQPMRITLRQLSVFRSLYETHRVSASAARLHLSPSAVSQSLKELESALGARLFVRESKGLTPTPAALTLLPYATLLVDKADEVEALFAEAGEGRAGTLAVGANRRFGIYVLSRRLMHMKRRMPAIETSLMIEDNDVVEDAVAGHLIDVGFISGRPTNPDLDGFPCFEDRFAFVVGLGSPLMSAYVTARELSDATWVLEREQRTQRDVLAHLEARGIRIRHSVTMDTMGAVKRAAGTGLGVALLPYLSVREEILRGDLVEIMKPASTELADSQKIWAVAQGYRRRASQRLFPGLQHRTDRLTAGREGHGQKRPSGRSEAAVFLELKCDPRASGFVSARRAGVPCASADRSSTSRELRERRSNGRSRTRAACRSRSC